MHSVKLLDLLGKHSIGLIDQLYSFLCHTFHLLYSSHCGLDGLIAFVEHIGLLGIDSFLLLTLDDGCRATLIAGERLSSLSFVDVRFKFFHIFDVASNGIDVGGSLDILEVIGAILEKADVIAGLSHQFSDVSFPFFMVVAEEGGAVDEILEFMDVGGYYLFLLVQFGHRIVSAFI